MPLIDLLNITKLKSLKWGNDQPHGGSSNEPYIKVDINKLDSLGNQIRFSRFDDGLVRGGALGALQSSTTDLIRIGKFLTDFPKGPLFIAKQVGLQLSNPKTENGLISPLRNVSGTGAFNNVLNQGINLLNSGVRILNNNSIGPTRIYNLGINTLAQVPLNAFGGHVVRHGFSPVHDEKNNYEYIVSHKSADDNRLVTLSKKFELGTINQKQYPTTWNNIMNFVNRSLGNSSTENMVIDDYIGGPDSVYGIGRTRIRRFDNTEDESKIQESLSVSKNRTSHISIDNFDKVAFLSKAYGLDIDSNFKPDSAINYKIPSNFNFRTGQAVNNNNPSIKKFNELQDVIKKQKDNQSSTFEGKLLNHGSIIEVDTTTGNIPSKLSKWSAKFTDKNIETRIGLTNGTKDLINLTPLFDSASAQVKIPGVFLRDLVKFRIEAIDSDNPSNSTWMIFRSYLKNITDNPNPSWTNVKYVGRGEKFWMYESFSRTISLNFQVAALSAGEMEPMYQKMNFLYSNTAPDYDKNNNFLRGPLIKLTIGNYIYRELGFISSLQYSVSENTPWEIAITEPDPNGKNEILMYELPMIMDINMTFTVIHNFLPQKSIAEAPFIINKPIESINTTNNANAIDNPWLKQKNKAGKYTKEPLVSKK